MKAQFIIAGLSVVIVILATIGTIKYVKELNKIRWDDTHEELD